MAATGEACGTTAKSSTSSFTETGPITLRVAYQRASATETFRQGYFEDLKKQFERAHLNVAVELDPVVGATDDYGS